MKQSQFLEKLRKQQRPTADPAAFLSGPTPSWMPPPMSRDRVLALCTERGIDRAPANVGFNQWAINYLVTPPLAYDWLTKFQRDNRDTVDANVKHLSTDLLEGNWQLHHQGIAFSPDGFLQDGQHRLYSIYTTGIAAPLHIVFNVTDRARVAIDTQARRRPQDVSHAYAMATGTPMTVQARDFPILRNAVMGASPSHITLTNTQLNRLAARHRQALDFVHNQFTYTPRKITSPALAAILRAHYYVDTALLAEYCAFLRDGHINGTVQLKHTYARLMREWLLNLSPLDTQSLDGHQEDAQSGGSEQSPTPVEYVEASRVRLSRQTAKRREIYGRTVRSIRGFVAGEITSRLTTETNTELWPLPQ